MRKEKCMEIQEIVKIVKSVNEFAETIRMNDITFNDIKTLSTIDKTTAETIKEFVKWFSHKQTTNTTDTEQPWLEYDENAEWVPDTIDNLVVSSSGLFWSLHDNSIVTPRFVCGDLRIDLPTGETKRAAVIVAKTFRLWSHDRNSTDCVMWYKDGDHRNIHINNLVWKKRSECLVNTSAWKLLIEDICRRIIEHDCDIDKILSRYNGSDPKVDKILIKRIMTKEKYSEISDKFFVISGTTIIPREDIITKDSDTSEISHTTIGYDIGSFLITTGDKVIAKQLLIDKVKDNRGNISEDEKAIMVFSAIEQIGGKQTPSTKSISRVINEIYDVVIPFDIIDNIRKTGSKEISSFYIK